MRLVPYALQAKLPLLPQRFHLPFELLTRRERKRKTLRRQRLKDEPLDCGIEAQASDSFSPFDSPISGG